MANLSLFTKLSFLAALVLLFVATTHARDFSMVGYSPDDLSSIDKVSNLFESWIEEKYLQRFEIFKENLKHIDERNKAVSKYWLGLNEFADMRHDEFKKMYLGLTNNSKREMNPLKNTLSTVQGFRGFA